MTGIIDSLKKSFKWTTWNIFFGLLPAWLALPFSWLGAKDIFSAVQEILIKENALMFFSVAVITAITIDFKMAIESKGSKDAIHGLITTWNKQASRIVVLTSAGVYAYYYVTKKIHGIEITGESLANITMVSLGVFVFTIVYVLILKFYQIRYRPF
jgi:hypothetical protein